MLQFLLTSARDYIESISLSRHIYHLAAYYGRCSLVILYNSVVTDQRGNEIQHTKLHHFPYITQSKLQHILYVQSRSQPMTVHVNELSSSFDHPEIVQVIRVLFYQAI